MGSAKQERGGGVQIWGKKGGGSDIWVSVCSKMLVVRVRREKLFLLLLLFALPAIISAAAGKNIQNVNFNFREK